MQRLGRLIYPIHCLSCDNVVEAHGQLCPQCWGQTPFIVDHPCETCGAALVGEAECGDLCDACLMQPRPWRQGRALMRYDGGARGLVLALKHGDRPDLAPALGAWLAQTVAPIVTPDMRVVPVPLHWRRLMRRRYNQAALLASHVAKAHGLVSVLDGLKRCRATRPLDGVSAQERHDMLKDAIAGHPKRAAQLHGHPVLLVDDVMTSGATLTACTQACHALGATQVSVAVLARVDRTG
nr:ComF family protein [uncultured Celeribacter sp.]